MSRSSDVEVVYVWELPVRLTHWAIAFSIVALAGTGYYLGNPFFIVSGPAAQHFVTGTMKVIHFYAAIVFTIAVAARLLWLFVGGPYARWRELVPTTRRRWKELWETFLFYTMIRPHPPDYAGHNPLAGATYVAVFGIYLGMIATGAGIYAASAHTGSWLRGFGWLAALLGGLQWSRWLHHIGMWLLLGFTVHHVFSALLGSAVEHNGEIDSIFSGYKAMPIHKDKKT